MDDFETPGMDDDQVEALFEEALLVIEGSTPERAVQMLEDVLAAVGLHRDIDDPEMIEIRMYLGRALWLSGLAERAIPILRAAWADAVRVTGPVSRLSFSCSGNLCRALGRNEEFEEALTIALEAYELRESEYGELDNGTLNSLGHLSHLLFDCGEWENAVELMEELLERRTEAFGEDDPRTVSSSYNLAVMRARLANREDIIVEEAINVYSEEYGNGSTPVVNLHAQLAAIHEAGGRLEDALREWEYVERMRAELNGEVAIPTLNATARKLWVIKQLGDARVDNQIREISRTVARIAGPDHPLAQWCAEIADAE